MVVAQATKERDKFLEEGEEMSTFDSPSTQAKQLEYLLSTKFGPMWLQQQDEAYGDTLLHMTIELWNPVFTKIVLQIFAIFYLQFFNG